MTRIFYTIIMGVLFFQSPLFSQKNRNFSDSGLWPNGLTAKVLLIDYGTPNGRDDLNLSNGLELAYVRNISRMFNIAIPGKVGIANINSNDNKATIFSLDGLGQLQFYKKGRKIIPYLFAGGGMVFERNEGSNFQIPLGLGFNIRIRDGGYLTLQGEYRKSLEDNRDNLQYGLGWHFKIGNDPNKVDTDGDGVVDIKDNCPKTVGSKKAYGCPDKDDDGVPDKGDNCPEIVGEIEYNGCPDTDGDKIPDNLDDCPEEVGVAENGGCPAKPKDADEDGIVDAEDDCPNVAGTINGCPDTDGDGIIDKNDNCPTVKGLKEMDGCPDADGDGVADADDMCPNRAGKFSGCPDTDNDRTHDGIDKCPNEKGPGSNDGCPDIKVEDKQRLEYVAQSVQFETGSARLKQSSFVKLDEIAEIMRRYPSYRLKISGHTDNVGNAENNQKLSESRARTCYDYLVNFGISSAKIDFRGYGESQPIGDNNTVEGRRINRRTEFDLIFD